jgi:hypothetical protein
MRDFFISPIMFEKILFCFHFKLDDDLTSQVQAVATLQISRVQKVLESLPTVTRLHMLSSEAIMTVDIARDTGGKCWHWQHVSS